MKETPSNCKAAFCYYNALPPPENSQECIACPYLVDKKWEPKTYGKEKPGG